MKKIVAIFVTVLMLFSSLSLFACNDEPEKVLVKIKYADAQSAMTMLTDDVLDVALLPEPVATKLEKVKAPDTTWYRLDLQELYNEQTKGYPQAVLMVKNDVLNSYPRLIEKINEKFSENVSWAKENTADVVSTVKAKYDKTSLAPAKALTSQTIDNCKISWQSASDAKEAVELYIQDIISMGVGLGLEPAKQVNADFYYSDVVNVDDAIDNKTFTFVVPDGAPALAIAKFIKDNQNFVDGATFDYKVVNADDISGYMNGAIAKADFIVMPLNSATLNHNNDYKLVSVITHGNLYLMSKTPLTSLSDLAGKRVGVIGNGKVPDLTFRSVLAKNNYEWETIA